MPHTGHQNDYCDVSQQVAKHHTATHSPLPSWVEERIGGKKIKAINLKPHKLHSGSRAGTHSAQALGRHQVVRRSNCLWPALDFST